MKLENVKRITSKLNLQKIKMLQFLIWKGNRQLATLKYKSKSQPTIITVKDKDVTTLKTSFMLSTIFLQI